MKKKLKIRKFMHRYRILIVLFISIIVFPLIVGAIYALPCPQIIAVDVSDLLSFYGVTFGLFSSFAIYTHEKEKEKRQHRIKLKPKLIVEVTKQEASLFEIKITNKTETVLNYVYLYDEFAIASLEKSKSFIVAFDRLTDLSFKINPDFNISSSSITSGESIIEEKDGYPKYVLISCDDVEGNSWNCYFYKIHDGNKVFYYPTDFELE